MAHLLADWLPCFYQPRSVGPTYILVERLKNLETYPMYAGFTVLKRSLSVHTSSKFIISETRVLPALHELHRNLVWIDLRRSISISYTHM